MARDIKFRRVPINSNQPVHMSLTYKRTDDRGDDHFNVFNEENGMTIGDFHESRLLGSFSKEQLDYVKKHGTTNFRRIVRG